MYILYDKLELKSNILPVLLKEIILEVSSGVGVAQRKI